MGVLFVLLLPILQMGLEALCLWVVHPFVRASVWRWLAVHFWLWLHRSVVLFSVSCQLRSLGFSCCLSQKRIQAVEMLIPAVYWGY